MILCDTNILVDALRSRQPVEAQFRQLLPGRVAISEMTVAELITGVRDKAELALLSKRLQVLEVVPITSTISAAALQLMFRYRLSNQLDFADALIAATALELDLPLFTLNRKHFHYLPGLTLYKP